MQTAYPTFMDLDTLFNSSKDTINDSIILSIKDSLIASNEENNQFKLYAERHTEFPNTKPKDSSQLSQIASMTISLFHSIKLYTESKSETIREQSLSTIDTILSDPQYSTYEIISPSLYQLLHYDIKNINEYSHISTFKSKYHQIPLTYLNSVSSFSTNDTDLFTSKDNLTYYYLNPNSFIHFIELQIELSNTFNIQQTKLSIINRLINFIIGYYSFTSKHSLNQYNEIINTLFKGLIYFSIEIIVKDLGILPKELIDELLISYLKISFELKVNSNEVYLFSLLSLLILYMNCDHITVAKFNLTLTSQCPNDILKHCLTMLNDTVKHINSGNVVILHIVLIKLIEYILIQKQSKDLNAIQTSIRNVNLNDFIMSDYALIPKVYDQFNQSINNFKEKLYWNFSEISTNVYMKKLKYPKIHKKTMMRYLCYEPDCKTLLYNLIQYYYANKNYRKTKILIQKILSSIAITNSNQIDFDIETIVLFIEAHIYLNEGKYEEAKDLCVLNMKRLEKSVNQTFVSRCYVFLGFSYSKLGDKAYNFDERNHNNTLALKYFEQAQKITKSNLAFAFYVAHQLYELKRYEDAIKFINECDIKSNIHIDQLKIILHITMMEYDQALNLCKSIIKSNDYYSDSNYNTDYNYNFNTTNLLKFYIQIYFQINYSMDKAEEEKLIKSIKSTIENTFNYITEQTTSLSEIVNQVFISKREDEDPCKDIKTVIRWNTKDISEKQFNESQSKLKHEIRNIEAIKITIIKDYYLLANYMRNNNLDNDGDIMTCLKEKIAIKGLSSEDINKLLIAAIQSKYADNDNNDTESLLKKVLEINPTHMVALKLFVDFLIKEKKDYANAYVYCIKAIKIDDKEIGLWEYLSQYYFYLKDQTKYSECMMKEIENSRYHSNAFLNGLLPKVIL